MIVSPGVYIDLMGDFEETLLERGTRLFYVESLIFDTTRAKAKPQAKKTNWKKVVQLSSALPPK